MTAECRARAVIDIVLEERNGVADAQLIERLLQELVAGHVVGDHIAQVEALGRRVLEVPHVQIEAAPVEEEPAVARRFLVIAVMKVDAADVRLANR